QATAPANRTRCRTLGHCVSGMRVTGAWRRGLMGTGLHGETHMHTTKLLTATFVVTTLALGGCASNLGGDTYSRAEARQVQTVRLGTIEMLRPVRIEGTKTPIGAGAGAVIGGVAGSGVGGGRGSAVAAVVGAVAGGLLGAMTEEGLTRTQGVEITVRED